MYLRELLNSALAELRKHQPEGAPVLSAVYVHEKSYGRISTPSRTLLEFSTKELGDVSSVAVKIPPSWRNGNKALAGEVRSLGELVPLLQGWKELLSEQQGRLSIYELKVGNSYAVSEAFKDYDGKSIARGTEFTFLGREYLPYDDGHTIKTSSGNIRLQGSNQKEVIENFDKYIRHAH